MGELAVSVRLAILGMTAVTVHLDIFWKKKFVKVVLLVLFLIQSKSNAFVSSPKKYMLMESAYVSKFLK